MRKTPAAAGLAAIAVMAIVAAAQTAPPARAPQAAAAPTFTRDVAPILFSNCTQCHRPGEIAPMSLLTYRDARPWAKAIQTAVLSGVMPPWHADAQYGEFANDRRLTDADRETISRWVAAGAPEGDPADLPPAPTYVDGWQIGRPDVVLEMTEDYAVPAEGTVEYEWMYIPTNFTEPKYVQAIEIRPGNRKLVHHVLAFYRAAPGARRSPIFQVDRERQPAATESQPRPARAPGIRLRPRRADGSPQRLLATYVPGTSAQVFPAGTALRLEPGGVIELQMHYTANGTAGTDRTKVGLIFSTTPNPREVVASQFLNGTFRLPAGAPDVRVDAAVVFQQDAIVWGLFPHTHLRGKRWEYRLVLPDGTERMILSVPKYDFNWQTYYMFREPLPVPKGARIVSSAWYDNSRANPSNPDPAVDVFWGDQTWEEMQYTGLLFSPAS